MASFTITTPDGKSYTVEKEGATREQALAHVQKLHAESQPEREYTVGEQLGDVGTAAAKGGRSGGEFMLDVGMFPTSMALRLNQGMVGAATRDGDKGVFKRFWEGVSKEPEIEGVSIGDVTHAMMNPSGQDLEDPNYQPSRELEYTVPEGKGGKWLEPAKTGARLGSEMIVTAPMGGPKYLKQALMATPAAAVLGAGGSELDKALGGEGGIGEMAGVVTGAIAGDPKSLASLAQLTWRKLKIPPAKLISFVKKPGSVASETLTDAQLRGGMTEIIRNIYPDDPRRVAETLDTLVPKLRASLDSGELGTLGQLTNDPGILAMEKEMAMIARENQHALDLVNAGISEKALSPIDTIAPAGVTADAARIPGRYAEEVATEALDVSRREAGAIERTAAGQLDKAKAAQAATEEAVGAFPASAETAEGLGKSVGMAKDKSLAEASAAFNAVGGDPITGDIVRNSVKAGFEAGLNPNDLAMFKASFPKTFERIGKLEGEVTLDTLSNVISLATSEANMLAKGSSSGTALQFMDRFQESLLDAIDIGGGDPAMRKKAAALYRAHMQRYGDKSQIGKALKGDPDAFNVSMLTTGDKGLGKLKRLIKGDRASRASAEKSLRALFKQRVVDPETGAIRPAALKSFLSDKTGYGQHLDSFPAFRKEIEGMSQTTAGLKTATSDMTAAETTAAALRKGGEADAAAAAKSVPAQFGAAGDDVPMIIEAAKKIMTGPKGRDRVPAMIELMDSVKANPQAKEDLRRAFMESFTNTVTKDGKLTNKGIKLFKRDRAAFEKSGMFSADELQRVEDGLVEGQKLFLHENARRLAKLPLEKQRLAGTLAALGGAKLGAYSFGSPLIGASLGRKAAVSWLDSITVDQAKKIAFDLSTNPQQFADIFAKLDKQALTDMQGKKALETLLARITSAAVTGEE